MTLKSPGNCRDFYFYMKVGRGYPPPPFLIPKAQNCLFNNVATLVYLLLRDDEGRREADDVAVGWFGEQAAFSELQANVAGRVAVLCIIDDDGIQQALAAH